MESRTWTSGETKSVGVGHAIRTGIQVGQGWCGGGVLIGRFGREERHCRYNPAEFRHPSGADLSSTKHKEVKSAKPLQMVQTGVRDHRPFESQEFDLVVSSQVSQSGIANPRPVQI